MKDEAESGYYIPVLSGRPHIVGCIDSRIRARASPTGYLSPRPRLATRTDYT